MRETIANLPEEGKAELLAKYNGFSNYIQSHSYDMLLSAFIMEACFKHIELKHKEVSKEAKAWAITIVMRNYDDLLDVGHIEHIIDKFIAAYTGDEYVTYCKDIVLWNNMYAKDAEFVRNFISQI